MPQRTIEQIRERATRLSNNSSRLAQRTTELEERIEKLWREEWQLENALSTEDAVEAVEETLEEAEDDLRWTQITLEALEWVLGETDVQPELVIEEERSNYEREEASTNDSEIHNSGMPTDSESSPARTEPVERNG